MLQRQVKRVVLYLNEAVTRRDDIVRVLARNRVVKESLIISKEHQRYGTIRMI